MHKSAKVWWATRQLRRGRRDVASYVTAAPVRERLAELEAAGWTRRRVAAAALVSPSTLTRIATPTTRWCSRIVARAVLQIEP
jgi:AraC-like DNA-binding protein